MTHIREPHAFPLTGALPHLQLTGHTEPKPYSVCLEASNHGKLRSRLFEILRRFPAAYGTVVGRRTTVARRAMAGRRTPSIVRRYPGVRE